MFNCSTIGALNFSPIVILPCYHLQVRNACANAKIKSAQPTYKKADWFFRQYFFGGLLTNKIQTGVNAQPVLKVKNTFKGEGNIPLFLLLDEITDVRNIGAITRTALCCGVQAIIIPEKGVGALNEDAITTSAGALEKIAVCRVNSLMKAVDELHLNGIKVFASEMTASTSIFDVKFSEPCAIVLGSEDKGIYPALMKICDETFKIPMQGDFESLNVSVAGGMILYEAMKQRITIA